MVKIRGWRNDRSWGKGEEIDDSTFTDDITEEEK